MPGCNAARSIVLVRAAMHHGVLNHDLRAEPSPHCFNLSLHSTQACPPIIIRQKGAFYKDLTGTACELLGEPCGTGTMQSRQPCGVQVRIQRPEIGPDDDGRCSETAVKAWGQRH